MANNVNEFDYFGLSLQNNSYDNLNFSSTIDTSVLLPLKYKSSSSEIGYHAFFGHQFNRYFAIEAGIASLGAADFKVTEEILNSDGKVTDKTLYDGEFETSTADFRTVLTYPLNESFFLKAYVGALFWDNQFTYLGGDVTNLNTTKVSDNGVSLLTGIGIGYGISKTFALSLNVENTEVANITTQNITFSLLIRL